MIAALEYGEGDPLLLVHGRGGPEVGWQRQVELAKRWRLIVPWRRGYGSSPTAERQDFAVDADDLLELVGTEPVHAAAFSYGALGLLEAAGREPGAFLSLTLVEPVLFGVAASDPEVTRLGTQLASLGGGSVTDEVRGFLVLGAAEAAWRERLPESERPPVPPEAMRSPAEAAPDLEAIRSAGIPALVISGDHHPGMEHICDALAGRLDAERAVVSGEGHSPQRADGFNERFEQFLDRVG